MPPLKVQWTAPAKAQYEELRKRSIAHRRYEEFRHFHNRIAEVIADLDLALAAGEILYHTNLPGGEVHHWQCNFISVWYAVFPQARVGFVTAYRSFPESWPM